MTRFVTSAHTANKLTSASLLATILCLLFVLSALGKIEVIILYSVGNVLSLLDARV